LFIPLGQHSTQEGVVDPYKPILVHGLVVVRCAFILNELEVFGYLVLVVLTNGKCGSSFLHCFSSLHSLLFHSCNCSSGIFPLCLLEYRWHRSISNNQRQLQVPFDKCMIQKLLKGDSCYIAVLLVGMIHMQLFNVEQIQWN
jgi:hypothetical protein